jgi:hypothetical protein
VRWGWDGCGCAGDAASTVVAAIAVNASRSLAGCCAARSAVAPVALPATVTLTLTLTLT